MSPIVLGSPSSLAELSRQYGGTVDPEVEARLISAVARPAAESSEQELTLIASRRAARLVAHTEAALLVSPQLADQVAAGRRWVHESPWWAMAAILERAVAPWSKLKTSSIADDVVLAPTAVVHAGAVIGAGSRLEPHSVIYGGVELGARVIVGAGAVVGRPGFGFAHAPNRAARRIPQLGGVIVGDDVEIGALCTIDSGTLGPTVIGRGSKLDAHVHVGHNVVIGERCFMAAQVGLAGSVELGDDVWLGGQAGVSDHVHVGSGARIAAKSGVISDVPNKAQVAGFPAVARLRWLRRMTRLMRAKRSEH